MTTARTKARVGSGKTSGRRMTFPAIQGRMGSRPFYVVMFPIGAVPRFFSSRDWAELPPEMRAQRKLSDRRVPEIARYILEHEDDWVFSSLTASFQGEERFKSSTLDPDVGVLGLPFDTPLLINDGQHRRAAIEEALHENPLLAEQMVSVVLFREEDLNRNQQIFSDLNRTVQKTSRSLDILFDKRDPMNWITLAVAESVPIFKDRVEKDTVSLAVRSSKFVTVSALYDATNLLVGPLTEETSKRMMMEKKRQAIEYWIEVSEALPPWKAVRDEESKPSVIRAETITGHAVFIWALGAAGRSLLEQKPTWKKLLRRLAAVSWAKTNKEWQGRCMLGPDIITRRQTRAAMAEYLEWKLGLRKSKPPVVLKPHRSASRSGLS